MACAVGDQAAVPGGVASSSSSSPRAGGGILPAFILRTHNVVPVDSPQSPRVEGKEAEEMKVGVGGCRERDDLYVGAGGRRYGSRWGLY